MDIGYIFNKVTGEIVSTFSGYINRDYYATTDLGTSDGVANVGDYLVDGVMHTRPPSPSPNHTFDYTVKEWVDARSLEEAQAAKWEEIKQARSLAEFGPFFYNGMVFDGDVDAQRRLAGCISISKSALAAGQDFQTAFTLADNTVVTLTANEFVGVEMAKLQSVATAFSHASALRAQIQGITSISELNLLDWNTGL